VDNLTSGFSFLGFGSYSTGGNSAHSTTRSIASSAAWPARKRVAAMRRRARSSSTSRTRRRWR
jgi:hypothetical protein